MEKTTKTSPSGRYTLTVSTIETKPGCWSYTLGVVAKSSGETIAEVKRNYSAFPFLWVEDHPTGKSFLVCGKDYQGQTVIELDTGARKDVLPPEAKEGNGFCWAAYTYNREQNMLVVDGCYWACPYEYRFYDFSDPMSGWPQIGDGVYINADGKAPDIQPDNVFVCYETREEEDDSEGDEEPKRRVVATKTYKRDALKLNLISEWIDDDEKKRRDENAAKRKEWEDAWEVYKKTDPLYGLVRDRVASDKFDNSDYCVSVGVVYDGWCPHFTDKDSRVCRRIAERRVVGSHKISIDLEWGREAAPIKLEIYSDGGKAKVWWFDRSIDGMNQALDHAKDALTEHPSWTRRMLGA